MDKQTLSNYGWLVIVTLILAVMLALATPFGTYVGDAVVSIANGYVQASDNAIDEDNIGKVEDQWDSKFDYSGFEEGYTGANKTPASELPAKGKMLEEYTWSEVQQIIQAGKTTEYNFKVGDLTRTFSINDNAGKQARIVNIDNDKVTFMLTSSIGDHNMNAASADYQRGDNIGGYADSEMKAWLDGEVYNNLDANLKAVISPITITCADGCNNPNGTKSATCYLFLPSIKEVGLNDDISGWGYSYMTAIEAEGETFDWFAEGGCINDDWFWLRSPDSGIGNFFFIYGRGLYGYYYADYSYLVYPAFVIG